MTDFIQITTDVFYNHKDVVQNNDLSIKIKAILDKYACFHDYTAFQSYTSRSKKHNNNNAQSSTYSARPKLINNSKQTGTEREITGLLNKISKQNYSTILRQILRIIDASNTNEIVVNILQKCYKQPCFIDIYIGLLHDLYVKSNNETRQRVYTLLSEYIMNFIHGQEFKTFHLDSANYDEFCQNMTNKNDIIGKHRTIIAVIMKILRNNLIDEYFNIMFNEIIQLDNLYEKEEFERHELLLDIMSDFVKVDTKYKGYIEKYYKTHVQILEGYTSKARFKVLDMVTIQVFRPM
jgi:hypothetical protein